MTRVTITKEVANRKEGDTVDLAPGAAAFLIAAGYAEAAEQKTEQPKRGRPRATRTDSDDPKSDETRDEK